MGTSALRDLLSCVGGEGREVSVSLAWPCCHAGWELEVEQRPVSIICWSCEVSGPLTGPSSLPPSLALGGEQEARASDSTHVAQSWEWCPSHRAGEAALGLRPSPASPVRVAVHSAGCRQREDRHVCTTFSGPDRGRIPSTQEGSPSVGVPRPGPCPSHQLPLLSGSCAGLSISEAMGLAAVWAWVFAPRAQTTGVRPLPLEGAQSWLVR